MRNIGANILDWHPKPRFYYGWLVLGTAALGAFIATGVAQTVLGGIQDLIANDMGWDRTTIAFAATIATWVSGMTMPFVGKLVDRYGPRYMMLAAALIVSACSFTLSGVNSVWQFYIAYIISRSFAGPNLQNLVPRTVAVNFFRRKRNLALGITALNRIGGEALNLLIITLVASAFSWRAAYRTLGIIALPLCIPLFLIMRRRPEDIGLRPDGDTAPSMPRARAGAAFAPPAEYAWGLREVIRKPPFWFIVWAEFLSVTTTAAVAFQLVPFLTDNGMPYRTAAFALMISVLLGGLSVPLWGHLSDKFTIRRLTMTVMLATSVPTTAFAFIDPQSVGFYASIIWGIASGGIPIVGSMMIGEYFGRRSFGAVSGLTGPFRTAAMGLGPALGALIVNATDAYTAIFALAVASYIVSATLTYAVRYPTSPRRD
ncbi:MAG: MFS transporter [Chloroflexota bacterium]|nr:MFS transporter [Chloroflexota bacterium]